MVMLLNRINSEEDCVHRQRDPVCGSSFCLQRFELARVKPS